VLLERACSQGAFGACGLAAALLHAGYGRGYAAEAAKLNELGCVGGHGDSCIRYAEQVRLGDGVPLEPTESLRILEAACRLNSPKACGKRGAAEPDDQSREYFRRGCDGDDPDSCVSLANDYGPRDPRMMSLYLKACRDLGDMSACVWGRMICDGQKLPWPECRELRARAEARHAPPR
jgi:TPR repeat protein